jgi:FtsP/CotA-like multicopper oxidase with cupredoxin domain
MKKRGFLIFLGLVLAMIMLPGGINLAYANGGQGGTWYANSPLGVIPPGTAFGAGNNTGTALQKFIDSLPGVGSQNPNNLGQYIPLAVPDTSTFSGADFYRIGVVQGTNQFSTDLPTTTQVRGYQDLGGNQPYRYGGPLIIAKRNRPVRVLFTNLLPTGPLFLPVDPTMMGSGLGPDGVNSYTQNRAAVHLHGGYTPWISDGMPHEFFTPANDPTVYKRGASYQTVPDMWFDASGNIVSAGTAGATNDPGAGKWDAYYPNQQSNRLQFYHDHALGMTRLTVYSGQWAPYLITDPVEDDFIDGTSLSITNSWGKVIPSQSDATIDPHATGNYRYGIPLVVNDKGFVPQDIALEDPDWNTTLWGGPGNLYIPHVYEPNQSQTAPDGTNPYGRWDYGPWVWPNITAPVKKAALPLPGATTSAPWLYTTCGTPEAFMDTPVINGCAYPYLNVQPTAYRFRILNACNERYLNLSLFLADTGGGGSGATATATVATTPGPVTALTVTAPGIGYTNAPGVYINGGGGSGATATATLNPTTLAGLTISNPGMGYTTAPGVSLVGGGGTGATATATVTGGMITALSLTSGGAGYTSAPSVVFSGGGGSGAFATAQLTPSWVNGLILTNAGMGYTTAPTVIIGGTTTTPGEVKLVPAVTTAGFPDTWPVDGRVGGVPDPTTAGPSFIQIGSEGGWAPGVALLSPQPVNYQYSRQLVTVLNVSNHGVYLGPAERADVIIDFSAVPPGTNVIMYNDAPAPDPGFDPRYDYYTGDPDQTASGGAPTTLPGFGPNTRTIMEFRVVAGTPTPLNLANLEAALPAAYVATQPAPIVPETFYPAPYQATADTFGKIQDQSLTFTPVGATTPVTLPIQPKSLIELFDNYGRMNAMIGTEYTDFSTIPATSVGIGFHYADPPTENLVWNRPQIWKITHNGVDTHLIHIHLINWQLINRVGWDGTIRPPDTEERGWKETLKMNPLEDIYVAVMATKPTLPFAVPASIRLYDPTQPIGGTMFTNKDAQGNPITVTNVMHNFGWEFMWHCHLLGHEDNDMMRTITVHTVPAPINYLLLM